MKDELVVTEVELPDVMLLLREPLILLLGSPESKGDLYQVLRRQARPGEVE